MKERLKKKSKSVECWLHIPLALFTPLALLFTFVSTISFFFFQVRRLFARAVGGSSVGVYISLSYLWLLSFFFPGDSRLASSSSLTPVVGDEKVFIIFGLLVFSLVLVGFLLFTFCPVSFFRCAGCRSDAICVRRATD